LKCSPPPAPTLPDAPTAQPGASHVKKIIFMNTIDTPHINMLRKADKFQIKIMNLNPVENTHIANTEAQEVKIKKSRKVPHHANDKMFHAKKTSPNTTPVIFFGVQGRNKFEGFIHFKYWFMFPQKTDGISEANVQ